MSDLENRHQRILLLAGAIYAKDCPLTGPRWHWTMYKTDDEWIAAKREWMQMALDRAKEADAEFERLLATGSPVP